MGELSIEIDNLPTTQGGSSDGSTDFSNYHLIGVTEENITLSNNKGTAIISNIGYEFKNSSTSGVDLTITFNGELVSGSSNSFIINGSIEDSPFTVDTNVNQAGQTFSKSITINIGIDSRWNQLSFSDRLKDQNRFTYDLCEDKQSYSIHEYNWELTTTSVTVPSTFNGLPITCIENYAFAYCESLVSITIPSSISKIGKGILSGCISLESISVSSSNSAHMSVNNCLIHRDSKTLIAGCKTSIIPSEGTVVVIGEEAFSECSELFSITIPKAITHIKQHAFAFAYNLVSISYSGTQTEWNNIIKEEYWDSETGNYTVTCSDGTISKS